MGLARIRVGARDPPHRRAGRRVLRHRVRRQHQVRRRIVDAADGHIHGIGRTGEGRRPTIARRAHLRPRRAAGLVPRPEGQGRRTRPVVVGIRRNIQPRGGMSASDNAEVLLTVPTAVHVVPPLVV